MSEEKSPRRRKIRCYKVGCEEIARIHYYGYPSPSVYCCTRHNEEMRPCEKENIRDSRVSTRLKRDEYKMSIEHRGWLEIHVGAQTQSRRLCWSCTNGQGRGRECWVCVRDHKLRHDALIETINET